MRNPFARRHPFSEGELSAYLDGRLSPARSARLDEHLVSCEPCRRQLDELRAVVEGLRALSSLRAPRSFALSLEQVQAPQRAPTWAFGPAGAAAAALVAFVALVGVDLGTLGEGGAPEEVQMPAAAEVAFEGGEADQPTLGVAPAPTPAPMQAPMPGSRAALDEEKEAGDSESAEDAAAPEEAPALVEPPAVGDEALAPRAPATAAEEEAGAGRWVLRGFQAAAGAVFLGALAALLWRRRRRGVARPT